MRSQGAQVAGTISSARESARSSDGVRPEWVVEPKPGVVPSILHKAGAGVWFVAVVASHLLQNRGALGSVDFWTSLTSAQVLLVAVLPMIALQFMAGIRDRVANFESASARLEASVARFLEPTSQIGGNVVSIRHAVSSELAALNEQLNRSLEKSSAIEDRIRQEIGVLERTFSDNERRLLALVQELGRQRETVVSVTDQVRDVVKSTRETMNQELVELSSQLIEAGNHVRGALEDVNVDITTILTGVSESMALKVDDVITSRVDPVVVRIDASVRAAGELLASGASGIRTALDGHREEMQAELAAALERINDIMDEKSNAAAEYLKSTEDFISQSVEGAASRLQERLQHSSRDYLRVLEAGSSDISTKVEAVWGRVGQTFDARVEHLSAAIGNHVNKLQGVAVELQGSLMPALDQAGSRVASAVQLVDALEQSAGQLHHTLSVDARGFADTLSAELDGFRKQIAHAGQDMSVKLADKLEESLELIDVRAAQLASALQSVRDTMSMSTDKFTIAASEHGLVTSQVADELSAVMDKGAREMSARLEAEVAHLEKGVERGIQSYGALLADHSRDLGLTLEASVRADRQRLDEGVATLTAALAAATAQLRTLFSEAVAGLQQEVEVDRVKLESSSKRAADLIAEGARAAANDLTGSASSIVSGVAGQLETAKRDFSAAAAAAAAPLDRAITDLVGGFAARTAAFQSALDGRARSIEDVVTEAATRLEDQTGRLQRVVTQKVASLERFLIEGNEQLEVALDQHLTRLKVIGDEADLKRTHDAERQVEVIETVLEARGQLLDAIIRSRGQEFTDRLHVASQQFESALADTGGKIAADIATGGSSLVAQTSQQLASAQQQLEVAASGLRASLSDETAGLRRELEVFVADVARLMDGEKSGLLSAFDARVSILEKVISGGIEQVSRVADSETEGILERLGGGTESLRTALASESEKLTQGLTGNIKQVREAISEAAASVSALMKQANRELETTVARSTDATIDSLGQLSSKLIKQVSSSVDQVQQSLNSSSETVLARLSTQEKSAVRRIEQATQVVEESTRRAAEVTVDRLVALNGVVTQAIGGNGGRRAKASKAGSDSQS